MKTAAILVLLFLAFAAAGTSDYQIAADMAAERTSPVMIAAEGRTDHAPATLVVRAAR